MHLPFSSNLVTAVYVVAFDLLLQFVLSWLVHFFLSSRNIKCIYDDRTPFCLTSTRFAVLSHQGLSKKGIGRAVAIFSTVIVALAIAGSFSINGVSRDLSKAKRVAVLVDRAASNELVDFTSHVSEDGQFASDTFVAINGAANCYDTNNNIFLRYSAISSLQAVNPLTWRRTTTVSNSTCVTKNNGFLEDVTMRIPFLIVPWDRRSCVAQFKTEGRGKMVPAEVEMSGECPFEVSEAWCSTNSERACVARIKFQECYTFLIEIGSGPKRVREILRTCLEEKLQTTTLRSLAYLLDIEAVPFYWWAGSMVLLKVRTDVDIQEYAGEVNETDVNVLFGAVTLGSALLLMASFAFATYYSWKTYVVKAKRKGYNRFHSTLDMLSFTYSKLQKDGQSRFKRNGGIFLFLSDEYLHIKPDLEISEVDS